MQARVYPSFLLLGFPSHLSDDLFTSPLDQFVMHLLPMETCAHEGSAGELIYKLSVVVVAPAVPVAPVAPRQARRRRRPRVDAANMLVHHLRPRPYHR